MPKRVFSEIGTFITDTENLMLKELIRTNRSYRRFHQDVAICIETLRELVDLARLSASGGNLQPLKYVLSCDTATNATIFATLSWARYLQDWPGPAEGERPSAYVVVLGDTAIARSFAVDEGIAMQNMLLGAAEKGLGGCILGSVQKDRLREALDIPAQYEILHVVALGQPSETAILEIIGADGDVKYWRDEAGVHHVPKRRLEDIIVMDL